MENMLQHIISPVLLYEHVSLATFHHMIIQDLVMLTKTYKLPILNK